MLDEIEAFCTIAKLGGLSKAARALGLSNSMVTRRLANLEKILGVRLLQRTTRKMMLTEAGQDYYAEVSDILEQLQLCHSNLKNHGQQLTGVIKVGVPTSISSLYIAPRLHEFLEQYPQLKVTMCHGNHLFDLIDHGFDFVVHCGELPNSNFYFKKVGSWHKMFAASPQYLEKRGIPQTPADLAQHNCLDHGDNFQFTWQVKEGEGVCDLSVLGNVRVNSSMDLRHLAVNSLGIAYLPCFVIAKEVQEGRLVPILKEYRPPALGIYLVYPSKQYVSEKTRLFMDFVSEVLRSGAVAAV